MKILILSLVSLLTSSPAFANCDKLNLESVPFFGQIKPARQAAEDWVVMNENSSEGMLTSTMGIPERTDRTFLRYLMTKYSPETWIDERVTIEAGVSPFDPDLPEFTVDTTRGSLRVTSDERTTLVWHACQTGRDQPISSHHPFCEDVDPAEHPMMIFDQKSAVPMVATYLASKARSKDVVDAIRSELDVRNHYLLKVEAHFLRLKSRAEK